MNKLEKRWLPAAWLDETIPQSAQLPDDFLSRRGLGSWELRRLPDDRDDEAYYGGSVDKDPCRERLSEGAVVPFCWTQYYGFFKATFDANGIIRPHSPVPVDANCFRIDGDNERLCWQLHDLVQDPLLEVGDFDFDAYTWSDPIYFVFTRKNGRARFIRTGVDA